MLNCYAVYLLFCFVYFVNMYRAFCLKADVLRVYVVVVNYRLC